MNPALRDRLERCRTLPALSPSALHVLRLAERDSTDLADIGRTISADPGLGDKLVRVLNSALCAPKKEIASVPAALSLLGVNVVRTHALSVLCARDLRRAERPGFDGQAHWRRSLAAAASAVETARTAGLPRHDEIFLAALLQDVGVLALVQTVTDAWTEICVRAGGDHERLLELERGELGAGHGEVGRWLLERWRFPQRLRDLAAAADSDGGAHVRAEDERAARVMMLSGRLADIFVGPDPARAARRAWQVAEKMLCNRQQELVDLIGRVAQNLAAIGVLYDMDLAGPAEIEAAREAACRALLPGTAPEIEVEEAQIIPRASDGLDDSLRDRLATTHTPGLADGILQDLIDLTRSKGKLLSILLFDVDAFARLNTTLGRDAGDRVLRALGARFRSRLRGSDLCLRWEGARFLLVFSETARPGALVVSERLRKQVEESPLDVGLGTPVRVTVSGGTATLGDHGADVTELLAAAAAALRVAKAQGRNRVSVASVPTPRRGAA